MAVHLQDDAHTLPILTAEAYLAMDRSAEWKSEFHDGEMFPIEAVSLNHAAISVNLAAALALRLRSVGCRALGAPLRVRPWPKASPREPRITCLSRLKFRICSPGSRRR